jgi:uncharacterized protein with GYD domain
MATYIILMKLTKQGVQDIKNAPDRVTQIEKSLEAAGGKLLGFYVTMGEYDYVAIAEGPNDRVALAQLLGLGMLGTVRSNTLKAFSREEFAEILKALP